jgi:hypothetical protein
MHAALTVRKLKPGTYEDWRKAWEPDKWPEGVQKAYILRNVPVVLDFVRCCRLAAAAEG